MAVRRVSRGAAAAQVGNQGAEADVNTESLSYRRMRPDWEVVRALQGGTRVMCDHGQNFLPMEEGESLEAYRARLKRTVLFAAFARTVKSLVGKPFAKDIVLNEDVPEPIATWAENIDLNGRDISTFARDLFEDALAAGLTHLLVDMPPIPLDADGNPVRLSVQAERDLGRRPYWVHIKAEQLIGVRSQNQGGVNVLTQIRIREWVTEPLGEFGEEEVEQVRVIYPDRWEIWRQKAKGEWQIFKSGPNVLGEIPLVTIYTGRTGFQEAKPPLMDLANLNLQHWRSSSDQENILHVVRVPILFGKNMARASQRAERGVADAGSAAAGWNATAPITIGAGRMISGPGDSDLKYVEHTGNAISAGRQSILDIEDRMVVMGLELQVRQPQVQTATQKVIDTAESDSELHRMVKNLQAGLEIGLHLLARWGNIRPSGVGADAKPPATALLAFKASTRAPRRPDGSVVAGTVAGKGLTGWGGTVTLNRDFGISPRDAAEVGTLLQMRQQRLITRETFWAELQRRGVLSEEFDPEEEATKLEAEPPPEANPLDIGQPGARRPPPGGPQPPARKPAIPTPAGNA